MSLTTKPIIATSTFVALLFGALPAATARPPGREGGPARVAHASEDAPRQRRGHRERQERQGRGRALGRLAEELGLFPEQRSALREAFETQIAPRRRALGRLRRELALRSLLEGASAEVKALGKRLLEQTAEISAAQAQIGERLRELLNDEQRERLGQMAERLRRRNLPQE